MDFPNCADCAHVGAPRNQWCRAPQLAEVLDDKQHKNTMTPCEGVRDIKLACGHEARWFVKRQGVQHGR